MPSIIEGYNYDIFISYRQKDNKHDGWVTEFVNQLKGELEATFKEDISIYFDENPHDGLLETHDVNESLKDKLKCLVFIPIISRTYCDPKSFAWEHEFKAFIEQASKDQFGLKVKLPNGNVASRVLPVRIHDLDNEDIKLCESVLGGLLRGVEFIYRESGVNRPLKSDDDEKINLNKTKYRNQINKVANAIKEIITGIEQPFLEKEEVSREFPQQKLNPRENPKTKIITGSIIAFVLIVLGYLFIPKMFQSDNQVEKSIAVLPFVNDSPDQENTYFINGIMDEILNNLQKIKDFRVLSRTSTEQYRGANKPTIPEIAKKLDVNYLVEGSGQKYGNKFILRVQLIAAQNEKHVWGESFEREIRETSDIISIQNEIAQSIASALKVTMTPGENQLINKMPTTNLTAYDFYQIGREELTKYQSDSRDKAALQKAEDLFHKALKCDSTFAQAYSSLAYVYWGKHTSANEYYSENYVDSALVLCNIALRFDNKLAEANTIRGVCYTYKGIINKAIDDFDKALKINPNSWEVYYAKGLIYINDDFINSIDNFQKAASLNHGSILPNIKRVISIEYGRAGFTDKAKYYNLEALKLDNDSASYFSYLAAFEDFHGNYEKAIELYLKVYAMDSTYTGSLGYEYSFLGQFKESLKYFKKAVEIMKARGTFTYSAMHRIGYAYLKNGYKKEAEYYFDKQLEYSKNEIKLKRLWGQRLYPYYDLAAVYAFRGDKEKAYENLKIFNQRKRMPKWAVTLIKDDPLFNSIRNEPEFQQIVKDIEAKYQAEHERVRKWLEENNML